MTATQPPGFSWHPLDRYERDRLLLPRLLVEKLTTRKHSVDDEEDKELQEQVNKTIKQLMSRDKMSLEELYDHLSKYVKQSKPSVVKPYPPRNADDKVIQVFDMAAINKIKTDTSSTRNTKAVFNRFINMDTGERILKKVPKNFFKGIQKLKLKYPNCINFLEYVEAFAKLNLKQPYPAFYFPPVLLVGPPGIGKTAVVNAVANLIGVACRQVDMASNSASFILGGLSCSWSDAKTGVVINLLREGDTANPILILDEIDKAASDAKHDPLGPLYNLLEAGTAAKFIDEALDMPSNASHVLYVATANRLELIPKPILSRFTVLEINAMTAEQHSSVTQSIYADLLKLHGCARLFNQTLSESVIDRLRNKSPREIKSTLRRALAQVALRQPKSKRRMSLCEGDLLFSQVAIFTEKHYDGSHPRFGFSHH